MSLDIDAEAKALLARASQVPFPESERELAEPRPMRRVDMLNQAAKNADRIQKTVRANILAQALAAPKPSTAAFSPRKPTQADNERWLSILSTSAPAGTQYVPSPPVEPGHAYAKAFPIIQDAPMDPASAELAVLARAWDQHGELVRTSQREMAARCEEAAVEEKKRSQAVAPNSVATSPAEPLSNEILDPRLKRRAEREAA